MTVAELIEELKKYPENIMVFVKFDCGAIYASPDLEIEKVFLGERGYKSWNYDGAKEEEVLTII